MLKGMASKVAKAGRGGDEELAYLSPSSRELLKQLGGAGTINPKTGLPEYRNDASRRSARASRARAIAREREAREQDAAEAAAAKAASEAAFNAPTARADRMPDPVGWNDYTAPVEPGPVVSPGAAPGPAPTPIPVRRPATPVIGQSAAPAATPIPVRRPAAPVIGQFSVQRPGPMAYTPMFGRQGGIGTARDLLDMQSQAAGEGPGSALRYEEDMAPRMLAEGGEVSADEDEAGVGDVGSAQELLAQLEGRGPRSEKKAAPALKRMATRSDGASMPKGMEQESLGSVRELVAMAKDKGSARQQMQELARLYKLKIDAAQDRSRGLAASTFEAPTLEGTSLTKNTLATKRFAEGGEAKQDLPSVLGVRDYATEASGRLFPDQGGQDDQRDAARHMLAAAVVAKKYGPNAAKLLGLAHEYGSNPQTFFSGLGIGQPRDDFEYDEHNNRVGMGLASRATSREALEALVREMAAKASTEKREGRPWIMGQEQMDARAAKAAKGPAPRPQGYKEGGEVMDPEAALFAGRDDVPAAGQPRSRVLDEILGAGETALTLGTGAAASLAGMPYGLYKGLTSGKYLEGKAADIAGKEAAAFMERNTYQPRTESGQENLAAIAKIADRMKLAPTPGGAALASLARPTAVNAQVERLGMAAEKALEGPVTRTLERGGKAADLLQSFATEPARAVRPTGSTMVTGPLGFNKDVSGVDQLLLKGKSNARSVAGQDDKREALITDFWDKKARNYFTRQFGTPDDPIADAIAKKRIKGVALDEMFPEYLIDQIGVGTTRTNAEGQSRFFPKYPRAMDDFTSRYDKATGLRGSVVSTDPAMGRPDSEYSMSSAADDLRNMAREREEDRMLRQGVRPEMINTEVTPLVQSGMKPERVLGGSTTASEKLFRAYQEAEQYAKMTPEQQREYANTQFGNGRPLQGLEYEQVGENILPQNVMTAIQKGEPVYDIGYMDTPLRKLFDPTSINEYLATLPERQVSTIRFEDAVRGAIKMREADAERQVMVDRIKAGKPVADKVFSEGVSKPLVQFEEGPLKGFAWKRIEKREATVPEGAYVGHSVGGYETGGATYTADKRDGFNTGKYQVYTLRDNRNRPVNTVEVRMDDENSPVVTQIKGNGRATGNTAPGKYGKAVVEFLDQYLKPVRIEENDRYLTPELLNYKGRLRLDTASQKERDLYRELGLE